MDLSSFLGRRALRHGPAPSGTEKRVRSCTPSSPACSPATTPGGESAKRHCPLPRSADATVPATDRPRQVATATRAADRDSGIGIGRDKGSGSDRDSGTGSGTDRDTDRHRDEGEDCTLASGVVLRACADAADVDTVRTLNAGLLPLPCPERVYRSILGTDPRLCALAWAGSSVVGAITAVVETERASKAPTGALYIMTLAVVAPHRRSGLGSALLSWLLRVARRAPQLEHIDRLELHVHAGNSDALAFYGKGGFERIGVVERYYPRLEPPHAVRLRLRLRAETDTQRETERHRD